MDLYGLGCPEYDFTIFTKCLSVSRSDGRSVCDRNFETALAQRWMNVIERNFIFSCILAWTDADYILVHIAQEVPFRFLISLMQYNGIKLLFMIEHCAFHFNNRISFQIFNTEWLLFVLGREIFLKFCKALWDLTNHIFILPFAFKKSN